MRPIDYNTVLIFINSQPLPLEMPTLGRKSHINVGVVNNQITITNSGNQHMIINENHWNLVMNRIEVVLDIEKEMTSRYAHGHSNYNWNQSPHRIFSPYVPAIVRFVFEHN